MDEWDKRGRVAERDGGCGRAGRRGLNTLTLRYQQGR